MKYRVVLFDDNDNFKNVNIVDTLEEVVILTNNYTNYEVYKCNDNGNNYTHRRIKAIHLDKEYI